MSGIDIAVIVTVAALFVTAVAFIIRAKLKGKSSCDCGGDCAHCGACKNKNEQSH